MIRTVARAMLGVEHVLAEIFVPFAKRTVLGTETETISCMDSSSLDSAWA